MAGVEVQAVEKHIHMSAQKVRLVLAAIRGKRVGEALAMLKFLPNRAAGPVAKAVKSAAANAENNFNLDPEGLVVVRAAANEGRTLKRVRPRARGRVGRILKRSSHIIVTVREKEA